METYKIKLSKRDLKLLIGILKEAEENRSDMGCNDPYPKEEKLFTKKERIEMSRTLYDNEEDVEDMDGFLFNSQYVEYIINKIKTQTK